jgi:MYXO-CTERM domain-containing protein
VEEFTYDADGSFPAIDKTSEGVTEAVAPLIPYYRVEGETMAWGSGIEVEDCSEGGRNISNIEDGDYIKVEDVEFLTGSLSFEASVASAGSGGNIELRVDAVDGPLLGTCLVEPTGGWQEWQTVSCDASGTTDIHDLYLVFTGDGGSLFNLDFWTFIPKDPLPVGTGGADGGGGATAAGGGQLGSGASSSGPAVGGSLFGAGGSETDSEQSDGDRAGCSCSTTPRPNQAPWPWLLLGGAFILTRRISRRQRKVASTSSSTAMSRL